jgi:hypothetical protein
MKHLTCSIGAHRRTLACVLALLVSSAVAAGTINLGAETCTATQVCYNVPNNGGVTIDYISDATNYARLVISIDGDIYDSGLWAHPNLSSFTIYDGSGRPLSGSLSITITVGTTCHQSGRVCVYPKSVKLNGGHLVMP